MPRRRKPRQFQRPKSKPYKEEVTQPTPSKSTIEQELRGHVKSVYEACGLSQSGGSTKKSTTTSSTGEQKFWSSGTGYGNDSSGNGEEWNISDYISKQSTQAATVLSHLQNIQQTLEKDAAYAWGTDTIQDVAKFLVPVLEFYLFDVSFLDMESYSARYDAIFAISTLMAKKHAFQPFLIPKEGRAKSVFNSIKTLKSQTKYMLASGEEKAKSSASDSSSSAFSKQVTDLWKLLKDVEKRLKATEGEKTLSSTTSSSSSSSSPSTSSSSISSSSSSDNVSDGDSPTPPLSKFQRVWNLVTCRPCRKDKKPVSTLSSPSTSTSSSSEISSTSLSKEDAKIISSSPSSSTPLPDSSTPSPAPSSSSTEEKEEKTLGSPSLTKQTSLSKKQKKKLKQKETKTGPKESTGDDSSSASSSEEKKVEEKLALIDVPVETKEESKELEAKYIEELKGHRFRYIKDFREHHYITSVGSGSPSTKFMRRIQSEYIDLSKSLPVHVDASVFVRAKEENISLAQMMIMPACGPYQRGAFLFDVHFPSEYPDGPPHVNLQTTGRTSFRFNPNLYNCGKVCLSLLGTWHGRQGEGWQAGISTFLQVAVSVMSQIFVEEPHYNEPGEEYNMHTPEGDRMSANYNSNVRNAMIKFAMIEQIENPPPGFEYVTLNHFYLNKNRIIRQVQGWLTDGVKHDPQNEDQEKELVTIVGKLTKLLTELKKPELPKEDDDDSDSDDE